MNVYLLLHDEGIDAGESVRAVYSTQEAAEAALVSRTASGRPSRAWAAHYESCCRVEEREVEEAPSIDVREDDPPATGTGIIPDAVLNTITTWAITPNIYRRPR